MAGRPFENSHDLLWYMNDYSIWLMEKLLSDTDPLDTGIKNSEITPLLLNMEDLKHPTPSVPLSTEQWGRLYCFLFQTVVLPNREMPT